VSAYVHRHKKHTKHFSIEGCNEIKMMVDKLLLLIDDEAQANVDDQPSPIF